MSSREEFMRMMGLSSDDVVDPASRGVKDVPPRRSEGDNEPPSPFVPKRTSMRGSASDLLGSVRAAGGSESALSSLDRPKPSIADRAAFMRQMGIDNANGPATGPMSVDAPPAYMAADRPKASATDRAAFMRQMGIDNADPVGAPSAAPPVAQRSAPGMRDRTSFLREMGIDNAGGNVPGAAAGKADNSTDPHVSSDRPQPSASDRAAFMREMGIDNAEAAPLPQGGTDVSSHSELPQREVPKTMPAASRADFMRQMGMDDTDSAGGAGRMGNRNATGSQELPRSAASRLAGLNNSGNFTASGMSKRESAKRMFAAHDEEDSVEGRSGVTSCDANRMDTEQRTTYLAGGGRPAKVEAAPTNPALDAELLGLPESATVDEIKNLGNKFFQGGDYRKAVRLYSKAIERDQGNAALYSNRSAAYLLGTRQMGIDTRTMALRDADKVIKMQPAWFKGYSRRGDALFKLERFNEACEAYEKALDIEPANAAVHHSLEQCRHYALPVSKTDAAKHSWVASSAPELKKTGRDFLASDCQRTAGSTWEKRAELEEMRSRQNPGIVLRGNDWKEEQLRRMRERAPRTSSSGEYASPPTSMSSAPPAPTFNGEAPQTESRLRREEIPAEFSSDAAAQYQASLIEEYRRKKAARQAMM